MHYRSRATAATNKFELDLRGINQMVLPAATHAAVIASLKRETQRLLEAEGMHAFEMPRNAAIAHETSHAIVGTHEGYHITSVEISRKTVLGAQAWSGVTYNSDGPWRITSGTSADEALSRVRYMIAGVIGEGLFASDDYRSGSSLDEIVLAQMLIAALLKNHPAEFPAVQHPREIWSMCRRQTTAILKANADVARALMHKLDRSEHVCGKPLTAILRGVRKVAILENE